MENEIVHQVVSALESSRKSEELFTAQNNTGLPNRSVVIGLIEDIRDIVFPGYFSESCSSAILSEYYTGNCLISILERLKGQICLAQQYNGRDMGTAEEIGLRFIRRLPAIQGLLLKDVQAGYDGDPAAKSKEEIIFSYPGLFATYVYRIAHELYLENVPFIPRIMTEYAHGLTGIDINSGAEIGEYFFIDHGTGVVVGETTKIGNNVKLYQGVTLGALSTRNGQQLSGRKRHPTIEDNVTIYSGATILGGETVIGEGSVIGGNVFITESIPPYMRVTIKNPELTMREVSRKNIE